MFDSVVNNAAAVSTVSGLADYVVTGAAAGSRAFPDSLNDGIEYGYYASDIASGEWELAYGTWDSGAGSMVRGDCIESSNAGALVAWPDNSEKTVSIVMTRAGATQYALVHANKPEWEAIWLAYTGQSQFHNFVFGTSPVLSHPKVYDLSTDGTEYNVNNLDLRRVNTQDDYFYAAAADNNVNIGVSRRVNYGQWINTVSIPYLAACFLADLTGKYVVTCGAVRNSTGISDPFGWLYNPGSGNCADMLNYAVAETNAKAGSLPEDCILPDSPDHLIIAQGENDIQGGTPSGVWAGKAARFLDDCISSDRWGWADPEKIRIWWLDTPTRQRDARLEWSGNDILEQVTPEYVRVVGVSNDKQYDFLHYDQDTGIALGHKLAKNMASGIAHAQSAPAKRYKKALKPFPEIVDDLDGIWPPSWQFGGYSNTAPTDQRFIVNEARTAIRLSKTGASAFATPVDWSGRPEIENYVFGGTYLQMRNPADANNNYIQMRIASRPVDNGNYWQWPIVPGSFEDFGPAPIIDAVWDLDGTYGTHDDETYTSVTDQGEQNAALSTNVNNGIYLRSGERTRDTRPLYTNPKGEAFPGPPVGRSFLHQQLTGDVVYNGVAGTVEVGEYFAVSARVFARRVTPGDQDGFRATIEFMGRRASSSAWQQIGTPTIEYNDAGATGGITLSITSFVNNWRITTTMAGLAGLEYAFVYDVNKTLLSEPGA